MNAINAATKSSYATPVAAQLAPAAAARKAHLSVVDSFASTTNRAAAVAAALPPPSAPKVNFTPKVAAAAASFANNLSAVDKFEVGADSMTAAFLKLNVLDPNESVETHNELYDAATNLRQAAIDAAKKANDNARELQKEAEKSALVAAFLSDICMVASIAATAFSAGTAAPLAAAATAAVAAGTAGPLTVALASVLATCASTPLVASASTVAALQLAKAGATYSADMKQTSANQAKLTGDRHNARADEAQLQLSGEADIINTIVEQKNTVVDAVLQMMNATNMAKQGLMQAAFAH